MIASNTSESLIQTIIQGTFQKKVESLRELRVALKNNPKQFIVFADKLVPALHQLLTEDKQNLNLLASTLAIEFISLGTQNIKQNIQQSQLLRTIMTNLAHDKTQMRKTSHYCLLAYVRAFNDFDGLVKEYIAFGLDSPSHQLKQKSINSLQSIILTQPLLIDWQSKEFLRCIELLLLSTEDQSSSVQRAAEQCLISLCKMNQIWQIQQQLTVSAEARLLNFCQAQGELGNLPQLSSKTSMLPQTSRSSNKNHHIKGSASEINHNQKINKPQLVSLQSSYRLMSPNAKMVTQPGYSDQLSLLRLKKTESMNTGVQKVGLNIQRKEVGMLPPINFDCAKLSPTKPKLHGEVAVTEDLKNEKIQVRLIHKLQNDIQNGKNIYILLEILSELQTRLSITHGTFTFDLQLIQQKLIPKLYQLLQESNTKLALSSLKLIETILQIPSMNNQPIKQHLIDELTQETVELNEAICQLIYSDCLRSSASNWSWIEQLLSSLTRKKNSWGKCKIIDIIGRINEDENMKSSYKANNLKIGKDGQDNWPIQKIVEEVCKIITEEIAEPTTKTKVKALDLIVALTVNGRNGQTVQLLAAQKLSESDYAIYMQKIIKLQPQPKLSSLSPTATNTVASQQPTTNSNQSKGQIASLQSSHRRMKRISMTASISLQRHSIKNIQPFPKQPNSSVRTLSHFDDDPQITPVETKVSSISIPKESLTTDNSKCSDIHEEKKKNSQYRQLRNKAHKQFPAFDLPHLPTNNSLNEDTECQLFFADSIKQMKLIINDLKSEQWQVCYDSLTQLRRMIANHLQLINTITIKSLLPDLMRLTESLRSSLSKHAVIVLTELSDKVKRMLDSELELIFAKLIKKCLDSSSFILEEVKRALLSICSNCNEGRVIALLVNAHTTKANPIKIVLLYILEKIVFRPKIFQKDLQAVVGICVDYLSQGSLEIREKAKDVLTLILQSVKGEAMMQLIPSQFRNKLKRKKDTMRSRALTKRETTLGYGKTEDLSYIKEVLMNRNNEQDVTTSKQTDKKMLTQKIVPIPKQFIVLENLLMTCEDSDWKVRLESMTSIFTTIQRYSEYIVQHRLSNKIIDALSKQINDPNIKVAVNALKTFVYISQKIPSLIADNISVVLCELFNCFASQKSEIKVLGEQLFTFICNNVEKCQLIPHICNGCLYSLPKSRIILISKLSSLLSEIPNLKLTIFHKYIYPTLNRLSEEAKPEVIPTLRFLTNIVYKQVGEDCLRYCKPKIRKMIFQQ